MTEGAATAHAWHSTPSVSQLSIARFGGVLDADINATDSLNASSGLWHKPWHVLLPPVTKTIHSSTPGLAVAAPGFRTSLWLSSVRRSTFRLATFAAPDATGFGIEIEGAEDGIADEMLSPAFWKKPLTWSRKGICCAAESAGSASKSGDVRISEVLSQCVDWSKEGEVN